MHTGARAHTHMQNLTYSRFGFYKIRSRYGNKQQKSELKFKSKAKNENDLKSQPTQNNK